MTAIEVEKKAKKSKKSKVVEEVVAEEPVVEKKSKKSKKRDAEEETATEATEEPKKKKSKKNKDAEEEAVAETPAEEPKKEKKKKKKAAASDDEAEEPAAKKAKKEDPESTEEPEAESPKKEAESDSDDEPVKKAGAATETKAAAGGDEEIESTTVFIGGFPYETTEEVLKKDFEECGEIVNFKFPMDWATSKPKGIAFATYKDKEAVKKALEFNETDYGGRYLRVRVAADEAPGSGGKGGKKGDGKGKGAARQPGEKPEDCKSIIVKNLTYETTEDSLWELFNDQTDDIDRLNLLKDRETGQSKGIAFVDFKSTEAVDAAMKKQNSELNGRNIFIDYSAPKVKGEGKGDGKKGGKKGDGKGKGKKGDGKKGKGKGKKGDDGARAKTSGSIQTFAGASKSFDSDSD